MFCLNTSLWHRVCYSIGDEIEHSVKQTRNRFCGRLRPNARIQPQCQCQSPSYASDDLQRSGRWHDSIVARGGPRRDWFSATLPVEVTLAFKLGLKWSFNRTATFTSRANIGQPKSASLTAFGLAD
ncbi:unnamed protein product [uncultured bacterium]|nr:unnamed protein product [uncultured bacterium]